MPQHVQESWTSRLQDSVECIAISGDGRFIFAGGKEGHLYCFERSSGPRLSWQADLKDRIHCIALAEGCDYISVGCTSGKVYLWNYKGHLIRTFGIIGAISCIALTPTAHRIALSTDSGTLALFNSTGTLLWQSTSNSVIRKLFLTPDGQTMVVGTDNTNVYCFDRENQVRLFKTIAMHFWASSPGIPLAIIGSNDHHLSLFDSLGYIRWSYKTNDKVTAAAITFDGHSIVASTARVILFFNDEGDLIWQCTAPDAVEDLALSDDGSFILARTEKHTFLLIDASGACLWTHHQPRRPCTIALTPNGRLLAISQDVAVSLFENLQAPEEMSDAWLAQTVIRRFRRTYMISPQLGIVTWFEAFDYALLCRKLVLCQALLQEIRASSYKLSLSQQKAVESREGSFLLYQGLLYQRHGEKERAQQVYEQSREIQHRLRYQVGEGQALSALQMLRNGVDEDAPALLALREGLPELLGSSETLLVQGVSSASLFEQLQVVMAARRRGYLAPLLAALTSSYPSVQTAAAAALTWLQPGPDMNTLLDMLTSPHWLIRWEASLMLTQRAQQQVLTSQNEQVREAIVKCLTQKEDPFVYRNLLLLLGIIGDSSHEAVLLPLLMDPDPDVRIAAVETLGLLGTRQAITPLQQVKDGRDFADRSIKEYVGLALDRIYQRYPLALVQKVFCCRELTGRQQPVQPATLFFPNTPVIHCVVILANVDPGARISCIAKFQNPASIQRDSLQLQPIWTIDPEPPSTDMIFSFAPPRGKWVTGTYTFEVSINEKLQEQLHIKIIDQVPIKHALMCSGVDEDGNPLDERTSFIGGHTICCSVALGEAPVGLEVKGEAYHIEKTAINATKGGLRNFFRKMMEQTSREVFVMESKAKTSAEGEHSLNLFWKSHGWPAGDYIIKLKTLTGTEASCSFQIIPFST